MAGEVKYGGVELWDRAKGDFSGIESKVFRKKDGVKGKAKASNARFIRGENAAILADHLPSPGFRTHWILRGDFVFGDALLPLAKATGPWPECIITTLSLSERNIASMVEMVDRGHVGDLLVVVSEFWIATDKAKLPARLPGLVGDRFRIVACRNHTKIILASNAAGDRYVLEGSCNLRSANAVEQVTGLNDAELFDWHRAWIGEMVAGAQNIAGPSIRGCINT